MRWSLWDTSVVSWKKKKKAKELLRKIRAKFRRASLGKKKILKKWENIREKNSGNNFATHWAV